MNEERPRILVIVGTVRRGRTGRAIADWYLSQARSLEPQVDYELLDVADLDLPLFDEPTPPLYRQYSALQERLAEPVARADGFVLVSGEYNRSIPGSLKNFLDYLYPEWNRKPAALVTYGGPGGGLRAAEHLVQVMGNLGVCVVRDQVSLPRVWELVGPEGVKVPDATAIAAQLAELRWWILALRRARQGAGV